MSIGSIGSRTKPTTTSRPPHTTAKTVADHVKAADPQEPIRSTSTTVGTLVDTYL